MKLFATITLISALASSAAHSNSQPHSTPSPTWALWAGRLAWHLELTTRVWLTGLRPYQMGTSTPSFGTAATWPTSARWEGQTASRTG